MPDCAGMAPDFDALLDTLLAEELDDNPVLASGLGAEGRDHRLPDLSEGGFAARARREDQWLAVLDGIDAAALGPEQDVDRRLVMAILEGRRIMRDWLPWRRQPDVYVGPGLQGVFALFLHRLHPEPELAASAAARLRAVPELLAHGRANLDPELASPALVGRARGQCRAAVRYARELVPAEVADDAARAALAEAGHVAAAAYEDFAAFLDDLEERATGDFAIGEERYTALLRRRELLDVDTAALRAKGAAAYDALAAEMADVAGRLTGDPDWRQGVRALNRDHPATHDEMRAAYADWTERARAFLAEYDLVTLPEGERCVVEPSPPFQRPVLAVASYGRPAAFSPSLTGHFWVPYPPEGTPEDEARRRLETNNHGVIPATAVHEAYPGHHWHLVTAKANPRPVRAALSSAYFIEGWALYAEMLMREHGFFADDRHLLGQLDSRLFRAARITVDTGLHAGELTVDEAVAFMLERTSLSPPTARAEVLRYCAWPTQASAYLTGSLIIEDLRASWDREHPGQVRRFHDTLAGSGCLPIPLAAECVFGPGG